MLSTNFRVVTLIRIMVDANYLCHRAWWSGHGGRLVVQMFCFGIPPPDGYFLSLNSTIAQIKHNFNYIYNLPFSREIRNERFSSEAAFVESDRPRDLGRHHCGRLGNLERSHQEACGVLKANDVQILLICFICYGSKQWTNGAKVINKFWSIIVC